MSAQTPPSQSSSAIEVRLRQRSPLRAMRYQEDGLNVEAICRFIREMGGEFDGFTSGNHLYVYRRRQDWSSKTEVWPGDWIVGPVKDGIVPRSHADIRRDFERVDGAEFDA